MNNPLIEFLTRTKNNITALSSSIAETLPEGHIPVIGEMFFVNGHLAIYTDEGWKETDLMSQSIIIGADGKFYANVDN